MVTYTIVAYGTVTLYLLQLQECVKGSDLKGFYDLQDVLLPIVL